MLDIFSGRDKTLTNLIKLGTYLGRSLRENVQLFTVDSISKQACYLTENGNFISGKYTIEGKLSLSDIKIQASEILSDEKLFDGYVNEQVSNFVKNISSSDFVSADVKFSDILSLWEERFKLKHMQKLISEKSNFDKESTDILGTPEFSNFKEVSNILSKYINENYETFLDNDMITSIKKIKIASTALNLNKISYSKLLESGSYVVSEMSGANVYEALCQSELLRKELLEAKRSFEYAWASTDSIMKLSRLVEEEDETKIELALVEAVTEVPFLAMASKGQISAVISNCTSTENINQYKPKQIKEFASRIFELKKPIRSVLNKLLSEKYNINVLNLKEPVSMSSLVEDSANTFSLMSERFINSSVLKSVCESMASMLKTKGGVEIIDVNDELCNVLKDAGITISVPDFKLIESIDFSKVFTKDFNAEEVINSIKESLIEDNQSVLDTNEAPEQAETQEEKPPAPTRQEQKAADDSDRQAFIDQLKAIDDVFKDLVEPQKPESEE